MGLAPRPGQQHFPTAMAPKTAISHFFPKMATSPSGFGDQLDPDFPLLIGKRGCFWDSALALALPKP
jgi:hypothetical protein